MGTVEGIASGCSIIRIRPSSYSLHSSLPTHLAALSNAKGHVFFGLLDEIYLRHESLQLIYLAAASFVVFKFTVVLSSEYLKGYCRWIV